MPYSEDVNNDGAKIWLVPSNDVDCESDPSLIFGWRPAEILFEYDLITFDDEQDEQDDD